jgi:hypothetical protein
LGRRYACPKLLSIAPPGQTDFSLFLPLANYELKSVANAFNAFLYIPLLLISLTDLCYHEANLAVKDCDMDEVNQFKKQGDVRLTVPLAQGFEKILFDLVQITANKSGFDELFSQRIAEEISQKVFHRIQTGTDHKNHREVEISMSHGPGQITVKTEVSGSNFSEEVQFKAAETC